MPQFRKKPVVIEARVFDAVVIEQAAALKTRTALEQWCGGTLLYGSGGVVMRIPTLEGYMDASIGDWIIEGVAGEFYPCKPNIFEATYEPIPEPTGQESECFESPCVVCKTPVGTCEVGKCPANKPGHAAGVQLRDDVSWVCSERCFEIAADQPNPSTAQEEQ